MSLRGIKWLRLVVERMMAIVNKEPIAALVARKSPSRLRPHLRSAEAVICQGIWDSETLEAGILSAARVEVSFGQD